MSKKIKYEHIILIVMISCTFSQSFVSSALNISIISISNEFGSSAFLTGWISMVFLLMTAAMTLPFGNISKIFGKRNLFLIGIFSFTLFSFLTIFCQSIEMLIALRALQGISAAMVFSINTAIVLETAPPSKRGLYLGFTVSATYMGLSTGPAIGGFLDYNLGWRSIFICVVVVMLISFLLAFRYLKKDMVEQENKFKLDMFSTICYIIAIPTFLYAISNIYKSVLAPYILIASIVLFVLLFLKSANKENAIIPARLFKNNKVFLFSNIAALLNYCATAALSYILSVYLQTLIHLDTQHAGMILLIQPLIMGTLSPVMGKLSDKIEPKILSTCGMGVLTLGLFTFSFLSPAFPMWGICLNSAFIGVGFAMFSTPNTNSIMSSVAQKDSAMASSMLATMRTVGQALSMAFINLIISIFVGNISFSEASENNLLTCIKVVFIVFSFICLLGGFFSFYRGNTNRYVGANSNG